MEFSELRENLTRVGSNLKQGFIEAVRSTWETINHFARSHRGDAKLDIGDEVEETETAVVKPLQSQTDGEKELTQQGMIIYFNNLFISDAFAVILCG